MQSEWVSTIRDYPGPWAELDSGGKFIIMLPSSVSYMERNNVGVQSVVFG